MPDEAPGWSAFLGLGVVIAVVLVAGVGVGWFVDSQAGTGPIFLFVGLVVAIIVAVLYARAQFRQFLKP